MKRVRNGRGLTTNVTYAATTNSNVVTQTPSLRRALPSPEWVVSTVVSSDQWDPDASTTSYTYRNPVYSPDDEGRWGFRGFEEVTAVTPSLLLMLNSTTGAKARLLPTSVISVPCSVVTTGT